MRITSEGQVTSPIDISGRAGLLPKPDVDFQYDGQVVRIIPSKARADRGRGARAVARLRGTGDVAVTTDEIMALTRGEP